MDSIADGSPRRLARIAGGLYLINILGGAFAITVVPAMLVVQGDLAATAQNLQAHELLYRSGLAAHLVPWIQLPALIGEGSLCLWLLVVGINLDRWNQQASRATQLQSTHLEALP